MPEVSGNEGEEGILLPARNALVGLRGRDVTYCKGPSGSVSGFWGRNPPSCSQAAISHVQREDIRGDVPYALQEGKNLKRSGLPPGTPGSSEAHLDMGDFRSQATGVPVFSDQASQGGVSGNYPEIPSLFISGAPTA